MSASQENEIAGVQKRPMAANKITKTNRRCGHRGNLPGRGPGRPKGSPNKTSALLKDAILMAAQKAGGKGGLVAYLKTQAIENPVAFLALLGKVLPLQIANDGDDEFKVGVYLWGSGPTH